MSVLPPVRKDRIISQLPKVIRHSSRRTLLTAHGTIVQLFIHCMFWLTNHIFSFEGRTLGKGSLGKKCFKTVVKESTDILWWFIVFIIFCKFLVHNTVYRDYQGLYN